MWALNPYSRSGIEGRIAGGLWEHIGKLVPMQAAVAAEEIQVCIGNEDRNYRRPAAVYLFFLFY